MYREVQSSRAASDGRRKRLREPMDLRLDAFVVWFALVATVAAARR